MGSGCLGSGCLGSGCLGSGCLGSGCLIGRSVSLSQSFMLVAVDFSFGSLLKLSIFLELVKPKLKAS